MVEKDLSDTEVELAGQHPDSAEDQHLANHTKETKKMFYFDRVIMHLINLFLINLLTT